MPAFSSQALLSGIALVGLVTLAVLMVFVTVPQGNHDQLVYILGALSGAITVGGASKIADKLTTATGANPTIQPDAPR